MPYLHRELVFLKTRDELRPYNADIPFFLCFLYLQVSTAYASQGSWSPVAVLSARYKLFKQI